MHINMVHANKNNNNMIKRLGNNLVMVMVTSNNNPSSTKSLSSLLFNEHRNILKMTTCSASLGWSLSIASRATRERTQ